MYLTIYSQDIYETVVLLYMKYLLYSVYCILEPQVLLGYKGEPIYRF